MNDSYALIKEAYDSLDRKNFTEAIIILEKVLSEGAGDIYVLFLLSVAYLYTSQFAKADRFITKIREKNPHYLPVVQLEAFLKIKSASNYDEILKYYIDLYDKYPKDPHIIHGRKLLARALNFSEFQKDALLTDFVNIPKPPKHLKNREPAGGQKSFVGELDDKGIRIHRKGAARFLPQVKTVFIAFLVISAVYGGVRLYHSGIVQSIYPEKKNTSRGSTVDQVTIAGTDFDLVKSVNRKKAVVFYESPSALTRDFDRARKLIKSEKHNEAVIILNRIYISNASYMVKEKTDFLIKFIIDIDKRDYEDISYKEIMKKGYLYRGYSLKWKGKVTGITHTSDSTTFTLQVGCYDKENCPYLADVYSPRPVKGIAKGSIVEIMGVVINIPENDKRIYIESHGIALLPKVIDR